jgi:hypothetical protein
LSALRQVGAKILRTDESGDQKFVCDLQGCHQP